MESIILLITFLADLRRVIDEISALRVSLFFHEPWYNGKHYIFACNNEFMNEDICIIWKDSEVTKGTAIRQIVNEKDKKEGGRTEP